MRSMILALLTWASASTSAAGFFTIASSAMTQASKKKRCRLPNGKRMVPWADVITRCYAEKNPDLLKVCTSRQCPNSVACYAPVTRVSCCLPRRTQRTLLGPSLLFSARRTGFLRNIECRGLNRGGDGDVNCSKIICD